MSIQIRQDKELRCPICNAILSVTQCVNERERVVGAVTFYDYDVIPMEVGEKWVIALCPWTNVKNDRLVWERTDHNGSDFMWLARKMSDGSYEIKRFYSFYHQDLIERIDDEPADCCVAAA